ncbi:hypothetical protein BD780_003238 [Clostridium tetanomorphum]|uniref:Uncharacterized protein n=1 Tax=Clostridium tetanomorphum TaxID=1553 RepID=A0A923ECT4_CLOTT|nr:hypothetical protein [Clostridium tetanomorphum]KAJ51627.1 hypothetical protein CTM_11830 [Clostridium tetanomorphum DSM 665]KAJ53634.1 hypothetical protein CTM_01599 [Clostridium tetanomorphum DSM 665]MBC2399637.1 hypothetical protein [Clostridium tetanomorphum]MBP1866243.1 hypothetical protein [Clostridium tetanomorphum]NRS86013.1 hypothetical protein [Clostridium tetanomorphum]
MKFRSFKKRASALPIAIISGILLVSFSGILLTTLNNEIKINTASKEKVIAKNLAEAAIDEGIYNYNLILSTEKEVKDFKSNNKIYIKGVGNYNFIYKTPAKKEDKVGKFIGQGITNKGSKYTISVKIDTKNGDLIEWKEEK